MNVQTVIDYCLSEFSNASVDAPFKHDPDAQVLRHSGNRKWFALLMHVSASKLGLDEATELDILTLKVQPELNALLQTQPGFFPAYHMSKEHWLTLRLDAFTSIDEISDLLEASFVATR